MTNITFEMVVIITLAILAAFVLLLSILDSVFKFTWTCKVFGWHNGKAGGKDTAYYDGCSLHSVCSKCGKKVMQDGQGNWF